jgi:O-antigen/teichoic acid export membrane protein
VTSIRRDTALNLIGSGAPLLVAMVTIPLLLNALGDESFGLLALMWALVGYFGIFDFGVGRALTYEVAVAHAAGDARRITTRIRAGFLLTIFAGFLGLALVAFVIAPNVSRWFGVGGAGSNSTLAFMIIAIAVLPTTLTSGLRGALEGSDRFFESNINRLILGVLMFLAPYACVVMGRTDLEIIAMALAVSRSLVFFLALYQLRQSLFNAARPTSEDFRSLLSYGSWVTLSSTLSPLMVYGDRFLVASAVGASALAPYAVPQEGLQRLLIIPMALAGALMPRIAAAQSDAAAIRHIYYGNLLRVGLVMLPLCVVAAFLATPFLGWWISPDFARDSGPIVAVLCLGLWFNSLAQIPMTVLQGVARPKTVALIHTGELILYIALVYFFSTWFGLIGAAWAWSIRVFIDLMALHLAATRTQNPKR